MRALKRMKIKGIVLIITGAAMLAAECVIGIENIRCMFSVCFVFIGLVNLLKYKRIMGNDELLEKYRSVQYDERLVMISEKSGSLVFNITVYAEFIIGIALSYAGREEYRIILCAVCAQLIAYLAVYYILGRRY